MELQNHPKNPNQCWTLQNRQSNFQVLFQTLTFHTILFMFFTYSFAKVAWNLYEELWLPKFNWDPYFAVEMLHNKHWVAVWVIVSWMAPVLWKRSSHVLELGICVQSVGSLYILHLWFCFSLLQFPIVPLRVDVSGFQNSCYFETYGGASIVNLIGFVSLISSFETVLLLHAHPDWEIIFCFPNSMS